MVTSCETPAARKKDLGESFELANRPVDAGGEVADVDLHDLGAVDRTCVGHRDPDDSSERAVGDRPSKVDAQIGQCESRIRQPESEWERDLATGGIVAAVADEHSLAVVDHQAVAGKVEIGGIVLQ